MPRTLAVLALLVAGAAPALALPQPPVRVDLVTDVATLAPGQAFEAGIRLSAPPGWHVYWRNPGDVGSPPQMAWDLPPGFTAGETRWPAPGRISVPPMTSYAYDGGTTLVVPLTAPADLPTGGDVTLSGKLTYLACLEICVPGSADLSRTLAVGPTPVRDDAGAAVLDAAHRTLPEPLRTPVRVSREGGTLTLGFDLPGRDASALRNAYFYPESEGLVDASAEQVATPVPGGVRLALALADPKAPVPGTVAGILAFEDAGNPVAFATSSKAAATGATAELARTTVAAEGPDMTLWAALGLAFLGGLALNLMPCVFPVLSIKAIGLAGQAGASPARMRGHGLAYGAGVMASMLGLAGALLAAKAGGAAAGWGFQLQSPAFVAALACGLLLLGLSMSGVFHLGGRLTGAGDGLARREGFQGSFFTGVLAVLVATPCTAPFMGAAVGFALAQPAAAALAVFAALGAGLALPFVALAFAPGAVRLLPRPGAWMETLKGALAFLVYATVGWLAWVLVQQVGPDGLMAAFAGLVLAGFAAWCWGRADTAGPRAGRAARGLALAALAGVAVLAAGLERAPRAAAAAEAGVEPYGAVRLAALRAEGRTVFVDLTAAWCITCQVNERTTLASREVREAFRDRGVAYLKGDWTNADPGITRLLEEQGRAGVPLYLVYRGEAAPAVLPQVLTPGAVVAALPPAATRRVGALAR